MITFKSKGNCFSQIVLVSILLEKMEQPFNKNNILKINARFRILNFYNTRKLNTGC